MTGWARRARLALLLPALALLAACTTPDGSIVGIGVTETGDLVGYVNVCEGPVDQASIWVQDGDAITGWSHPTMGEGEFSSFVLTEPTDGWTLIGPEFTGLSPSVAYRFYAYGGQGDEARSSLHVDFTAADVLAMKPGQVRYFLGMDKDYTKDVFATVPLETFKSKGCR